jgi:energy-coupling factor transporter ATP-binding protein EcfA2
MSLLDQAKREAKRLYKLAQAQPVINILHHLPFNNLSTAKEYIANINGYEKWHDYEENLKHKDNAFGLKDKVKIQNEEKHIILNKAYFVQDLNFKIYHNIAIKEDQLYQYKEAKPIIIGETIVEKTLFKSKDPTTIHLHDYSYPVLISGSTGAGKTEILLTMAAQFIANKEGCIYVDAKGDNSLYYKMLGFCHQSKRQEDLYVLNFMSNSNVTKGADNKPLKKLSNSLDPINPLIGQEQIFIDLFGLEIGTIFNKIGLVAQSKNWLLNIDNIEAICMLPNLITWSKNYYWEQATTYIETYLKNIGYSEYCDESDFEDLIEQHALNCQKIKFIIDVLKPYYENDVFSITPEINIASIFKDRKILLVMQPALEKSPDVMALLANLINSQIIHFSQKNTSIHETNNHWQNIILDDFFYHINDNSNNALIKALSNKENKWIFGTQDFYYMNQDVFNTVINNSQTYIIMKTSDRYAEIPPHLKLLILDNVENIPPIFAKNLTAKHPYYITLDGQQPGMAYILSPKTQSVYRQSWFFERIKCQYSSAPRLEQIFLNRFPTKIILE